MNPQTPPFRRYSPELFGDSLAFERVHIKTVGLGRQDDEGDHGDVAVG